MARKPFQAISIKLGARYRAKRIRERRVKIAKATGLFLGAIAIGGVFGTAMQRTATAEPTTKYSQTVTNCRVVDGDTLRCDGGRIRLLGIDAPELPGHCAVGRDCAPGDPYEASRSLEEAMGDGASLQIENVGEDRYGRTLALVRGRGGDLSCWQLRHGAAIYKPRWDNGGRVAKTCPDAAHQ